MIQMSQQDVIRKFMQALNQHGFDNSDSNASTNMLNVAIQASSKYQSIEEAINAFLSAQQSASSANDFLAQCGITLPYSKYTNNSVYQEDSTGNVDTGAITGSDAGGSTTKNADDIVPEYGNRYTAGTSVAQIINTGSNDWIVKATSANDSITSGGADSIDSGAGDDSINANSNYATIKSGDGNDIINIANSVNDITLSDLNANDTIKISNFTIGTAKFYKGNLIVTDDTGSRKLTILNLVTAKNAKINNQTIADWLTEAGYAELASVTAENTSSFINPMQVESVTVENEIDNSTSNLNLPEDKLLIKGQIDNDTYEFQTELKAVAYSGSAPVNVNLNNALTVNSPTGFFTSDSQFKVNPATNDSTIGSVDTEFPNITDFNAFGLNVHLAGRTSKYDLSSYTALNSVDDLNADEKVVLSGLYKWWLKEGNKLIKESYNLGFDSNILTNDIDLYFYTGTNNGMLAYVMSWSNEVAGSASQLALAVNMNYYKDLSDTNVNGEASNTTSELDRVLAHEFTHAVMSANIGYFSKLPQFIKEGMAELTHGIDDERGNRIYELATSSNYSRLQSAMSITDSSTGSSDCYAAGYMFLRWLAKNAGNPYNALAAVETINASSGITSVSNGANLVNGTSSADYIYIYQGHNDTVKASAGNDIILDATEAGNFHSFSLIEAGAGNDTVEIAGAYTTIDAGDGDNYILARAGGNYATDMNMFIKSGSGNDTVYNYTATNSTIQTGSEEDMIIDYWSDSSDKTSIHSGDGNDGMIIKGNENTLHGGAGEDYLSLTGNYNLIFGDEEADFIEIGTNSTSNTIRGGSGNDIISLTGSANVIDYFDGDGNDIIYGFTELTTLHIRKGKLTQSAVNNDDLIFNIGSGQVTLVGAKDKNINVKYSLGSTEKRIFHDETLDGSEDTVPSHIDDGSSNPGKVINGVENKKKETLEGTVADDTLIGGKGPDILIGNKGNDIFQYSDGDGNDIINDYGTGEDTIKISSGTIKSATVNNKGHLILAVGKGKITVNDAGSKAITIVDSNGKYTQTFGQNELIVSSEFVNGAIDKKLKIINASAKKSSVNILGNANANSILTGTGNDTITTGGGKDTISYNGGNDIITDYATGKDVIKFSNANLTNASLSGSNAILTTGQGNITVQNILNKKNKVNKISINDTNGTYSLSVGNINTITGAKTDDILKGFEGNDYLTGAKGNDIFVFSGGNDTISDYSVAKKNTDTITLTGGLTYEKHYIVGKKKKDVMITFKNESSETTTLTLLNGKNKIATINGSEIELSDLTEKIFKKTDTISNYSADSDVIKIDASKHTNGLNIVGNSNANSIKGSAKNDTINGGEGNDTIISGKGNDLIIFSAGNDIVTDYTAGKDTIEANFTSAQVSGKHLIMTTANGTITLNNSAKKKITFSVDGKNSVTQQLGAESISIADADGTTVDLTAIYNSNVKTVDASKRKTTITIIGNSNSNTIKSGKGDDTMTGGSGKNYFFTSAGADVITDYKAEDIIVAGKTKITNAEVSGNDYKLTLGSNTITLKDSASKIISVQDNKGNITKYNEPSTTTNNLIESNNYEFNELTSILNENSNLSNDYNFNEVEDYNSKLKSIPLTTNKSDK